MSLLDTALEMSAAANASEAASQARAARNASEERLEGGNNPFINLSLLALDDVPNPGFFFPGSKTRVGSVQARIAVKRTDISHLVEVSDDFGTTYTRAFLEGRSNLYDSEYSHSYGDDSYIALSGTLEQNQKLVNG